MEFLNISVKIEGVYREENTTRIPFSGRAKSAFFEGEILAGAEDVQTRDEEGVVHLCAKYTLEGKDYTGQSCRIHIENVGDSLRSTTTPRIQTDSLVLKRWETKTLEGKITPSGERLIVSIYEV